MWCTLEKSAITGKHLPIIYENDYVKQINNLDTDTQFINA